MNLNAHSVFLGKDKNDSKNKVKNEAKRFDPSERNFNFEFRSWATALSEFVTLFLPLNSIEIQALGVNFTQKFTKNTKTKAKIHAFLMPKFTNSLKSVNFQLILS